MSKTFTREEVVEMLTNLTKHHIQLFLSRDTFFPWEEIAGNERIDDEDGFYNDLLGKSLTVLESVCDENKFHVHKSILKQLFQASHERFFLKAHNNFCDGINNTSKDVGFWPYTQIAEKLNS